MNWKTISGVVICVIVITAMGIIATKYTPRAEAAGSIISSLQLDPSGTGTLLIGGITMKGDHYWVTEGQDNFIYDLNAKGEYAGVHPVIKSGEERYGNLHGIVYVDTPTGGNFYVCSSDIPGAILKLDTSCSVISSFPIGHMGGGLTYDGSNLYLMDYQYRLIYKYTKAGSIITSFNAPDPNISSGRVPFGLTYDGQYLWCTSYGNNDMIYKMTTTGSIVGSGIPVPNTPNPHPTAIMAAGGYLIYADDALDTLYTIDK